MGKKYRVKVNGNEYIVEIEEISETSTSSNVVQEVKTVEKPKPVERKVEEVKKVETPKPKEIKKPTVSPGKKVIKAPIPGVIVEISVSVGERVSVGQKLMVIEAMKMENEILSDYDGVVAEILVEKGQNVEGDQELLIIE